MILTEKSENGAEKRINRSEDLFFFLEITINLEEKSERRNQSPLFFRKHQIWKFLPQAPKFEYLLLIMKINIFRDYYTAARK